MAIGELRQLNRVNSATLTTGFEKANLETRLLKMKKKYTAVDIFSGGGGLTCGLKQAGFDVIGAVEIDDGASQTYSLNHPEVKLFKSDIRQLTAESFETQLGIVPGCLDILAACPPCQGFSSLRTLNGKKAVIDPRNDLVFDLVRFIKRLRPRVVMIENVPGLAKDLRLEKFISSIKAFGYRANFQVINAAEYGVPQRRDRFFLVAGLGFDVAIAPPRYKIRTVRMAIGKLPAPTSSSDPIHKIQASHSAKVEQIIKSIPKNGGSRSALPSRLKLRCHKEFRGFSDVYGRMSWDLPSPTITGGCVNPSKGRFLHPEQDRCISLREAALLQTFPLGYKFPLTLGKYRLAAIIGNALPPALIRKQAGAIRDQLNGKIMGG